MQLKNKSESNCKFVEMNNGEEMLSRDSKMSTNTESICCQSVPTNIKLPTTKPPAAITTDGAQNSKVHLPMKKTPKFPSRERHMAIRRKKSVSIHSEFVGKDCSDANVNIAMPARFVDDDDKIE